MTCRGQREPASRFLLQLREVELREALADRSRRLVLRLGSAADRAGRRLVLQDRQGVGRLGLVVVRRLDWVVLRPCRALGLGGRLV